MVSFIDHYCDTENLPDDLRMKLHLITEEIATNAIQYGQEEQSGGYFSTRIEHAPDALKLIFTDNGKAFDPTRKAAPNSLDASLEERAIGGLGIYLVTEFAHSVEYERRDETNQLRVTLSI